MFCTKYDDRLGIKEWDWLVFKDPPSFQPIKLEKGGGETSERTRLEFWEGRRESSSLHAVKIWKAWRKIGFIGRDSCPMNLIFVDKCVKVFNKILVAVGRKLATKADDEIKFAMADGWFWLKHLIKHLDFYRLVYYTWLISDIFFIILPVEIEHVSNSVIVSWLINYIIQFIRSGFLHKQRFM